MSPVSTLTRSIRVRALAPFTSACSVIVSTLAPACSWGSLKVGSAISPALPTLSPKALALGSITTPAGEPWLAGCASAVRLHNTLPDIMQFHSNLLWTAGAVECGVPGSVLLHHFSSQWEWMSGPGLDLDCVWAPATVSTDAK
jgi:hypothetical protein